MLYIDMHNSRCKINMSIVTVMVVSSYVSVMAGRQPAV